MVQGEYSALAADAAGRLSDGEAVLIYAWYPNATTLKLRPGRELVWLQMKTIDLPGDQEPGRLNRVAWAVGLGMVAVGLMVAGGLDTVKAMTVVTSVSALPVLAMMCYTLYRWLQRDFPQLAQKPVYTLDSD